MNPFETETMADLCLRQGHHIEALAIYRRLLLRSTDEAAREREGDRVPAAGKGGGVIGHRRRGVNENRSRRRRGERGSPSGMITDAVSVLSRRPLRTGVDVR